jgi:hypothetical protein
MMDWQEVEVFSLNVQGVRWSTLTELCFTNDQILYLSQAIERTIVVSQLISINFTGTCENRAADPGESKECAAQEIRLKGCADPPTTQLAASEGAHDRAAALSTIGSPDGIGAAKIVLGRSS